MTAAAISTALLVAWGWLQVWDNWGVSFPTSRPPRAFRVAAILGLSAATAWLSWYFLAG